MAEKATIFQTVQIGVETTPGTGVAANRKLLSADLALKPRTEFAKYRAMGTKYPAFAAQGKEWSEISISGKPNYNELPYFFSSLLHYTAPVQQGGTAAYLWTFGSNNAAADVAKTYTVEQGDGTTAWKAAGVQISGLTFDFNRSEIGMNGTAVGQQITTGITMTASPTSQEQTPVMPTQLTVAMDTSSATLGNTVLTRGFSLQWSLTDKFGLAWPIGQSPVTVEGEPAYTGRLRLATDSVGMGLISTMRNGDVKWFRIKAEGAVIASTYKYTLIIDFPAQITETADMTDQDNLYVIEYGLTPIYDPTWAKALNIQVTCKNNGL